MNLSALLQPHRRPGKAARATRARRWSSIPSPTAPGSRRRKAYERQGEPGRRRRRAEPGDRARIPRASSYYYVLAGLYRRLGKMDESQKALESFKRLEREASELEKKRRERRKTAGGARRPDA